MRPEEQGENRGPTPPAEHRFKPGQSGNPGGRPKGRSITARLRELLDQVVDEETGETRGDEIAEIIVRQARMGDHRLIREVLDRTEGKVTQPVDVTTQGEQVRTIFYIPSNGRDATQGDPTAAGPPGDIPVDDG